MIANIDMQTAAREKTETIPGDRYAEALFVSGVTRGDWGPSPNFIRTRQFGS
jgi:hypothetical protein